MRHDDPYRNILIDLIHEMRAAADRAEDRLRELDTPTEDGNEGIN